MKYRLNQRTGDRISVIGLGTSYIAEISEKEAVAALLLAHENGINYADLATAGAKTFAYYGKAFSELRKDMLYQVHFGANYETGEYGWTTNLEKVKVQVDWMLRNLKTDYVDYGFIHCLDSAKDWESYRANGVLEYLLDMKRQGVVRHIGLSTHTPELANLVLDAGIVEQLMFSINPGYDYHQGDYANGSSDERMNLYRRCEAEGVGISVMKPFSGGQLLDVRTSPFKKALTKYQCIQYALDKPGVLTVLPGIRGVDDVRELLGFFGRFTGRKGLWGSWHIHTPRCGWKLCLLQPLSALSCRIERRSDQQVLRSLPGWGRYGDGPLCQAGKTRFGLYGLRSL